MTTVKSGHLYLEIREGKITMFAHFYEYHRICLKNESLYDFGEQWQEIKDISMDFEPCLKVHTMISVKHKSTHQTFSNDLSHRDLSCAVVQLLIC